jgi:putative ABC transport system permease protein
LSVGVVGALIGSVCGYAASAGLTYVYRFFFEFPSLDIGFYWHTHAIGLTVSLACATLGSLHGSRSMLRLQPAEAMRPEPPRRGRAIWLERLLGQAWTRLSATWRMALRALFRHRLRTVTGVFASAMGAGLLVCGLMMIEAQNFLLEFQFERLARSDLDLTFESERSDEALAEIRRMPGVDHAEPQLSVACTFVHGPYRRKGAMTGLVKNARLTIPYNTDLQPIPVPESGLVMTRRLADVLHVSAGQRIAVIPVKGERRPVEVAVTRIADSYLGLSAYAEIGYLSRLVGESSVMNGAQVVTDSRPEPLLRLYRDLKRLPAVESVQARRDMVDQLAETLLLNQYISIGVLIVFSGMIFFGSIVNASMVNLAERQREVATFLALGYTPWRIGGLFLRESMLTNMTGALLGLPLGYGLTWLTAVSYNSDLMRLPVVSAPWIWITSLGAAVVFALAAHLVVQLRIHSMDCREALQVKE